jgi:hypothetical protein
MFNGNGRKEKRMRKEMQSKIIQRGRKGKGLLGLAAGVIGTGMLLSQAQAAASLDP